MLRISLNVIAFLPGCENKLHQGAHSCDPDVVHQTLLEQVLSALEAYPKLVHRIGIAPRHLPALVEHTPVIAYELLLRLMRGPHIQVGRGRAVVHRRCL